MRFFPRNAQSRNDALLGKGHIGNHSTSDQKTALDRMLRYKPGTVVDSVLTTYGGSGG